MSTNLSIEVDRPYVPTDSRSLLHAGVEIEPGDQTRPAKRQLAICLDVSYSMEGWKLEKSKDGLGMVLGLLNDDDYLSLVTYSNDARIDIDATKWSLLDEDDVRETIDNMETRGGTDIYGGLEKAQEALASLPADENTVKEILLVSDGVDNSKDAEEFTPLAREINHTNGISIVAAGIGEDYDQPTIKTLAETSGGRWEHVGGPADILEFMGNEVDKIESTVAVNPELQVLGESGVEIVEAVRRKPQVQDVDVYEGRGTPSVDLPNLIEQENQHVGLQLEVPPGGDGEETVATIRVDAGPVSASEEITVTYTDDADKLRERNSHPYLEYQDTKARTRLAERDVEGATQIQEEIEQIAGETEISVSLENDTMMVEEADDDAELKNNLAGATQVED